MTTLRPGGACIVELPAGYHDDPPERSGLAALLAAVLNDPRCGGAPARAAAQGWRTRHRLDERCSSFGYAWSRSEHQVSILDHLRQTRLPAGPAGEAILADLRARQTAAIDGRRATPLALVGGALDRAAWGTAPHRLLGTPETVAAVTVADLAEAGELVTRARVYHADQPPDPGVGCATPAGRPPRWRGGLDIVAHPGSDARVAVRLPVTRIPVELLDLFVEVLGNGTDGRLHHELRHRNRLAYGFTAAGWGPAEAASIGATATVAAEHAAPAMRVLAATLRRLADGVDRRETGLARWRCRATLLAGLDGPFGMVDDARRQARGEPRVPDRLAVMAGVDALPGLSFAPLAPAVAAVGPFDERHRAELADVYEEIR
ncbi:insulinase family protein [Couchioplanes azureus]|uniref:insulinase family protein n=1 Tax=Couchioplanes caeruleus TaxID=56438 RepID=UPI001671585C|nr:insulinase family protein [Couchioplanes caeruleus]GGQ68021.1 hypothetical protein GCM10010166_42530 [Couchioplanes caeruleus subsp. azureus]